MRKMFSKNQINEMINDKTNVESIVENNVVTLSPSNAEKIALEVVDGDDKGKTLISKNQIELSTAHESTKKAVIDMGHNEYNEGHVNIHASSVGEVCLINVAPEKIEIAQGFLNTRIILEEDKIKFEGEINDLNNTINALNKKYSLGWTTPSSRTNALNALNSQLSATEEPLTALLNCAYCKLAYINTDDNYYYVGNALFDVSVAYLKIQQGITATASDIFVSFYCQNTSSIISVSLNDSAIAQFEISAYSATQNVSLFNMELN